MIGDSALILDTTPLANGKYCLHEELLVALAHDHADAFFFNESVPIEKQNDVLAFLKSNFGQSEHMQNPLLMGKKDLEKLKPDDIFLSLCPKIEFDEYYMQFACKKALYISYPKDDCFEKQLKLFEDFKVDLILTDFLPDEIEVESFQNIEGWEYFINHFLYLSPTINIQSKPLIKSSNNSAKILLIVDNNIESRRKETINQHSLVTVLRKSDEIDFIDISKGINSQYHICLKQDIASSTSIISWLNEPGTFHQIHLICQFTGKVHHHLGNCPLSPIRFLYSGLDQPHFLKHITSTSNTSIRYKVNDIIKRKKIKSGNRIPDEKSLNRLSCEYLINKIINRISLNEFSSLENCYRSDTTKTSVHQPVHYENIDFESSSFSTWIRNPIAPIIATKIVKEELNNKLNFDYDLFLDTTTLLTKSISTISSYIKIGKYWSFDFLNNALEIDIIADNLKKYLHDLKHQQNALEGLNYNTLRRGIWSNSFFHTLLDPEKRKKFTKLLEFGEELESNNKKEGNLTKDSFAWLLIFLLYQNKTQKALNLLNDYDRIFDDCFAHENRISSMLILWLIDNEEIARKMVEEYQIPEDFSHYQSILVHAIVSALTGCWDKAELSYNRIHETMPNIFIKKDWIRPRNLFLMQAIVYQKVGNKDYFELFLEKAIQDNPYWYIQKILLDRKIQVNKSKESIIPLFTH